MFIFCLEDVLLIDKGKFTLVLKLCYILLEFLFTLDLALNLGLSCWSFLILFFLHILKLRNISHSNCLCHLNFIGIFLRIVLVLGGTLFFFGCIFIRRVKLVEILNNKNNKKNI